MVKQIISAALAAVIIALAAAGVYHRSRSVAALNNPSARPAPPPATGPERDSRVDKP